MGKSHQSTQPPKERDYTNAEFDQALLRSQGTTKISVAIRLLTIAAVYGLLAYWIANSTMPTWLLIVPMVFEFIFIMWFGYVLALTVVDCPAFAATSKSPIQVIIWTLIALSGFIWKAGFESPHSSWSWHHIPAGATQYWRLMLEFNLPVVLGLSTLGLLVSTVVDIHHWKRHGGAFVWTSIFHSSFRLGVIVLLFFFGMFGAPFIPALLSLFEFQASNKSLTWALYWFLMVVEVLAVFGGLLMTLDAKKKLAEEPAKPKR